VAALAVGRQGLPVVPEPAEGAVAARPGQLEALQDAAVGRAQAAGSVASAVGLASVRIWVNVVALAT
jgi:hypothetical protein